MRPVLLGAPSAAVVRWSFLRHFRREIFGLVGDRTDSVATLAAASARRLVSKHRADLPDAQGLNVITFAALVLAGFRALVGAGVGRPEAYEAVRRAQMATLATPVRWMVRRFLALSRDPVAVASRPGYLRFMQAPFGRLFRFDQRTSADRADLIVTHCGFHQFFVAQGEPLLNHIMCEWDHNLFAEMNTSGRPLRMSRPETISTGCDQCVFRHDRTDGTGWEFVDVVLERRPETLAALADREGA